MNKPVFSLFDMDGMLRNAGAERVDEHASRKLSEILEDSAKELMHRARVLAYYAGRKDITRDDIRLAAQMVMG